MTDSRWAWPNGHASAFYVYYNDQQDEENGERELDEQEETDDDDEHHGGDVAVGQPAALVAAHVDREQVRAAARGAPHLAHEQRVEDDERRARHEVDEHDAAPEVRAEVDVLVRLEPLTTHRQTPDDQTRLVRSRRRRRRVCAAARREEDGSTEQWVIHTIRADTRRDLRRYARFRRKLAFHDADTDTDILARK